MLAGTSIPKRSPISGLTKLDVVLTSVIAHEPMFQHNVAAVVLISGKLYVPTIIYSRVFISSPSDKVKVFAVSFSSKTAQDPQNNSHSEFFSLSFTISAQEVLRIIKQCIL